MPDHIIIPIDDGTMDRLLVEFGTTEPTLQDARANVRDALRRVAVEPEGSLPAGPSEEAIEAACKEHYGSARGSALVGSDLQAENQRAAMRAAGRAMYAIDSKPGSTVLDADAEERLRILVDDHRAWVEALKGGRDE